MHKTPGTGAAGMFAGYYRLYENHLNKGSESHPRYLAHYRPRLSVTPGMAFYSIILQNSRYIGRVAEKRISMGIYHRRNLYIQQRFHRLNKYSSGIILYQSIHRRQLQSKLL